MKLKTTYSVIKNTLSDIRTRHDFSYTVPTETSEKLWNKECGIHPTKSTCKTYDV